MLVFLRMRLVYRAYTVHKYKSSVAWLSERHGTQIQQKLTDLQPKENPTAFDNLFVELIGD